jgi:quercetin dioxygenase-like cupin family protein
MPEPQEKPVAGVSHAQAHALRELVAVQAGSVVSRQILKREKGNLTLFAFDAGQELSEHTAPFDAAVLVLEGAVEITISGRPVRAEAGELVIMPAHQPHALKALTPFKMLLTMIRE